HEYHVAALTCIEQFDKPGSRCFRDLAGRNQKQMIEQNLAIRLWIENGMIDCHASLSKNVRHVFRPAGIVRVDLALFHLRTKIKPVARWKLVLHPQIFPKLEGLILMAGRADPPEAQSLKKRDENLFDEVVFAGVVKKFDKLLSLLNLLLRERAGCLRKCC